MITSAILFSIACKLGDVKRDKDYKSPDDVIRYDNIRYGKNRKWNVLDVYRPKSAENSDGSAKKLPVFVDIHGGGWVYGDKNLYQFYCMHMAQKGFAVVNFTYRLAPMWNYKAQLEDTNNVIKFIFENKEKFNFDTDNIFLAGDSAGAHLASFYSEICTSPELASKFKFKVPENFVPNGLLLNCGIYKFRDMLCLKGIDAHISKRLAMCCIGKPYLTFKNVDEVSTALMVNEKFPKAFIMGANNDNLMFQTKIMSDALTQKGVPHVCKIFGDEKNPLNHVFHIDIKLPAAQLCNEEEAAFLKGLIND